MKTFAKFIDGYDEITTESEYRKKYGRDYCLEKGRTRSIIDRIHPDSLSLRISEIIEETPLARTIRLVSDNGYLPPFLAGQYINVFTEIDGVRTSRPYSISSSPRQRAFYDITVARIEKGFVSDYLLERIRPGDTLEANGPAGNLYFNPVFHGPKLVLVAGGSGITPFMSMIREMHDAGLKRDIHLVYGNRTEENVLFAREIEDIARKNDNFTYNLIISEPGKGFAGESGFITSGRLFNAAGETDKATFYVCGPRVMYDFVQAELDVIAVPRKRIRREMSGALADPRMEPGWPEDLEGTEKFDVKVRGKGTIEALSGEPLLVSLERAGLRIPVSCRSGECSMCRVKLVSGRVFQPGGVLLREADERYGYIHSCRSYPMEDLEIIL